MSLLDRGEASQFQNGWISLCKAVPRSSLSRHLWVIVITVALRALSVVMARIPSSLLLEHSFIWEKSMPSETFPLDSHAARVGIWTISGLWDTSRNALPAHFLPVDPIDTESTKTKVKWWGRSAGRQVDDSAIEDEQAPSSSPSLRDPHE